MKIGLSTIFYDTDGFRSLKQQPDQDYDNQQVSRRCSRVATLDGGAVVTDFGYSAADRTYTIKTVADDSALTLWAERIVKTYSSVHIATAYGFFTGTPSRSWVRGGYLYIEILITSQEDE